MKINFFDTQNKALNDLEKLIDKIAISDFPVLILGETGTGKELLAEIIHEKSNRGTEKIVKINCTALPETLLESELFGHTRGAFTGAISKSGLLAYAHKGTLFLDEIGDISNLIQAKLLRAFEDKSYRKVGANETEYSNFRLISATNKLIEHTVRIDFIQRINTITIELPPLRNRVADIPKLATTIALNLKKTISGAAINKLSVYSWPGNIRELQNVIRWASIVCNDDEINDKHIKFQSGKWIRFNLQNDSDTSKIKSISQGSIKSSDLVEVEKRAILEALDDSLWVQKNAAAKLGISPRALNYKIALYGISHENWRVHKKI